MRFEFLLKYDPVLLAFLATVFTWLVTAAGSSLVYFFRTINRNLLNAMLGFSAGVMIAASFWSLLLPSIEMCSAQGRNEWLPAVTGFLAGGYRLLNHWSTHRVCSNDVPGCLPGLNIFQSR